MQYIIREKQKDGTFAALLELLGIKKRIPHPTSVCTIESLLFSGWLVLFHVLQAKNSTGPVWVGRKLP